MQSASPISARRSTASERTATRRARRRAAPWWRGTWRSPPWSRGLRDARKRDRPRRTVRRASRRGRGRAPLARTTPILHPHPQPQERQREEDAPERAGVRPDVRPSARTAPTRPSRSRPAPARPSQRRRGAPRSVASPAAVIVQSPAWMRCGKKARGRRGARYRAFEPGKHPRPSRQDRRFSPNRRNARTFPPIACHFSGLRFERLKTAPPPCDSLRQHNRFRDGNAHTGRHHRRGARGPVSLAHALP